MSSSIDRVQEELESLGFIAHQYDGPHGKVVAFPYTVEVGTHKGDEVLVGVSFQEEGYPEYPPHWIHVSPPLDDGRGGSTNTYDGDGHSWLAMSRPPGALWDRLPTKHMQSFITEHLRRIWMDV